jgi:hypothetical protein
MSNPYFHHFSSKLFLIYYPLVQFLGRLKIKPKRSLLRQSKPKEAIIQALQVILMELIWTAAF